MKSRIQLIFVLCFGMMMGVAVQAASVVVDSIVGFDIVPTGSAGTYTFWPLCGVPGNPAITPHRCKDEELKLFLFEWKFGNDDYSVEAKPTRTFTSNTEVMVILRPTGLKEDERTACIGVSAEARATSTCMETYRLAISPDSWVIFPEIRRSFKPSVSSSIEPILPAEYHSLFSGVVSPAVRIAPPYCLPMSGAEVIYPVVFYNPTPCDFKVDNTTLMHEVLNRKTGSWDRFEIGCEDFYPNTGIICGASVVHLDAPRALGVRSGSKSRRGRIGMNFDMLGFNLPASSYIVVLIASEIPGKDTMYNESAHRVIVTGKASVYDLKKNWGDLNVDASNCNSPVALDDMRKDNLVNTIDPNEKWISHPKAIYRNGDVIRFAIQFQNVGSAAEELVYVEDQLSPFLDKSQARFEYCVLRGPKRQTEFVIKPQMLKALGIAPSLEGDVYRMQFSVTAAARRGGAAVAAPWRLLPGDTGTVFFNVPVKAADMISWLPSKLKNKDIVYHNVENRGYTMFANEGVVYKTDPVTFVVAQHVEHANALFWWLLILLILLLIVLVYLVVRWWRKRKGAGLPVGRSQSPVPQYVPGTPATQSAYLASESEA